MPRKGVIKALLLILAGFVCEPLIVALLGGALAGLATAEEQDRQVDRLVQAHAERHRFRGIVDPRLPDDLQRCGRGADLFGVSDTVARYDNRGTNWSPYIGLLELQLARDRRRGDRWHLLQTDDVRRRLSPFAIRFLAQCIRTTVAAPLCDYYAGSVLDQGRWNPATTREDKMICAYLDGIAAQETRPPAK